MKDIVLKYLQQTATQEDKTQLLEWLSENEENKKTFSEMRDLWLSEEKENIFPPFYIQQSFFRFSRNIERRDSDRSISLYPFILKIAASIALLLMCGLGGYWLGKFQKKELKDPVVMNQVIMGKESKGAITLPDGTVVWLNANSKLMYPDKFSPHTRKVSLEGEGYFEVVKNEASPFLVETKDMVVRVLGTHFDVKNYPSKKSWEMTLLSGKVEVNFLSGGKTVVMQPGQRISCPNGSDNYQVNKVEAAEYILWINDKLVFTNEYLSVILHQLKHWYGMDIVCEKDIPLTQRLSLTIRKESPEEIFKLLELISPIHYKIEGDRIYLRHK